MTDESDEKPEVETEPESEEEPETIAEEKESKEEEPEIESEPEWILIKDYRRNTVYLRIEGAIINPNTLNRAPFNFECKLDTGFNGGLYYEGTLISDAETVNVQTYHAPITLANGTQRSARACIGHIEKIDGHDLPYPGIPVTLFMHGNPRGLIGMDALKSFIVLLDGINQKFKIRS